MIKDNGSGYEIQKEHDLDALGLTLINALANQINASFAIVHEKGTKFEFNLDISE